jgi:hypothetical protein
MEIPKLEISNTVDNNTGYYKLLLHFNIEFDWNLANKDIKVLSVLYIKLIDMLKSGMSFADANILLFSKHYKTEFIKDKDVDTTMNVYANMLCKYRKVEILSEDNVLSSTYMFKLQDKLQFVINYGFH